MLVIRGLVESVITTLSKYKFLSLDTETTGLRPYHGDRLFSLMIACSETEAYYFNFWPYDKIAASDVLSLSALKDMDVLWDDPDKVWFIHKFNFDMHMLGVQGIELAGEVHCTQTQGRVEYNEHHSYKLSACLKRIGLAKDDKVEEWISKNKAYESFPIEGKQTKEKKRYYHRVPFDIIVPYGLTDATGCYALGKHQIISIEEQAAEINMGSLTNALKIERRLAKTVYRMEKVGVKIDRHYCRQAISYELERQGKATGEFKALCGKDYKASSKLFTELFLPEKDKWQYGEETKTGQINPSFESDVLKTFSSPLAKEILKIRDTKSRLDFYYGFLFHADKDGIIHAQFNPGGARTFRFSTSNPNLQNLTSEEASFCAVCEEGFEDFISQCPNCQGEITHPEFRVRKAIIPRDGFIFIMPDYDQMEYRVMLDYAKHLEVLRLNSLGIPFVPEHFEVVERVLQGWDVHKATAELMGVSRKHAKTLNFMLLYGGGGQALADALGIPLAEAYDLRQKYFRALPYVERFISQVQGVIKTRGWIKNWAGYKYHFPDKNFAFTGPNTMIQGGCAIVTKIAMNKIDEILLPMKSRLVLSIHDELPCEVHESEIGVVPHLVKEAMETVYPHKYIPLTVGMEWASSSLADKKKGFPV